MALDMLNGGLKAQGNTTADAQKRPYPEDDVVNANIYSIAQEVDRILHRYPVEDHAAVLGIVQVTTQKRLHAHQTREGKKQQEAMEEAQRRARFGAGVTQ